jgi:hypothetical protein
LMLLATIGWAPAQASARAIQPGLAAASATGKGTGKGKGKGKGKDADFAPLVTRCREEHPEDDEAAARKCANEELHQARTLCTSVEDKSGGFKKEVEKKKEIQMCMDTALGVEPSKQ